MHTLEIFITINFPLIVYGKKLGLASVHRCIHINTHIMCAAPLSSIPISIVVFLHLHLLPFFIFFSRLGIGGQNELGSYF